jgi:hypothetical protein
VRVRERWSDTGQSRGVYAGAFGARVGVERASQARRVGALMCVALVLVEWQWERTRLVVTVSQRGRCVV